MTLVPMNCLSPGDCVALGVNITTARRSRVVYPKPYRKRHRNSEKSRKYREEIRRIGGGELPTS